mmetsp:Transcript_112071/g.311960  ORF Transcript_112071/g.311960 Transcript_112071/m.311960 type:complete len:202 (+) Transcript_112071:82-687(+)
MGALHQGGSGASVLLLHFLRLFDHALDDLRQALGHGACVPNDANRRVIPALAAEAHRGADDGAHHEAEGPTREEAEGGAAIRAQGLAHLHALCVGCLQAFLQFPELRLLGPHRVLGRALGAQDLQPLLPELHVAAQVLDRVLQQGHLVQVPVLACDDRVCPHDALELQLCLRRGVHVGVDAGDHALVGLPRLLWRSAGADA